MLPEYINEAMAKKDAPKRDRGRDQKKNQPRRMGFSVGSLRALHNPWPERHDSTALCIDSTVPQLSVSITRFLSSTIQQFSIWVTRFLNSTIQQSLDPSHLNPGIASAKINHHAVNPLH
jgi:hypothetical protein